MKKLHGDFMLVVGKRLVKNILVKSLLITVLIACCSSHCFSQEQSAQAIDELLQNPKLNAPQSVLQDFIDGKSTTRVIVDVRETVDKSYYLENFNDMQIRQQLKEEVKKAVDQVINAMDPSQVCVKGRFAFGFGFGAEVTAQGLQDLVDQPDVVSIRKDRIISIPEPKRDKIVDYLFQSPKIRNAQSVLQDFMDGKSTTRVIVDVRETVDKSYYLENFNDMQIRQQLKEEVKKAVDQVINDMDPSQVCVKGRFTFCFGFGAEVTLQGLRDLVDQPEIVSIGKDEIIHVHTAQGIPLINASTVRSSHSGAGVGIAMCDTGINASHAMSCGSTSNGGSYVLTIDIRGLMGLEWFIAEPEPPSLLKEGWQSGMTEGVYWASYRENETVLLSPVPKKGWRFRNWGGDLSGIARYVVITMDADKYVQLWFKEVEMGDIDSDSNVSLADAIVGLQIMGGINALETYWNGVAFAADVNGDDKIGIEDIIYVLQIVSELRQKAECYDGQ